MNTMRKPGKFSNFSSGSALVLLGVVSSASLVACGKAGPGSTAAKPAVPSQALVAKGCGRVAPGVGAARVDNARVGGAVALARLDDRTVAYVADEDDNVLHTVDLGSGRELVTTPLLGSPSQVLVAKDGRVLVTLRDKNQVQVLEPTANVELALTNRCSIDVPAEPVALAASPDDATVLVTSGWGRALSALDGDSLGKKYQIALAREPRQVVVSDDGTKAFVAHVVGSRMSSVDLATPEHPVRTVDMSAPDDGIFRQRRQSGKVASLFKGAPGGARGQQRMGCQSFTLAKSVDPPGRIFAPQVLVDPGDLEQQSSGYGDGQRAAEVASIGVIDEGKGEPLPTSLHIAANEGGRFDGGKTECLLPRASATDAKGRSLFVTCLGIDAVVEYDAVSADPRQAEKRRWNVPAGPTGIAIDGEGRRAVVWSQFDQVVSVISLDGDAASRPALLGLSRKARSATDGDVALGRRLFHLAGDNRISADGRACASCHPDGRDDSLTWATPEGPRNTPMLAGRLTQTAPYGWNGESDEVKTHLGHTFSRLQGRGLEPKEVDAMVSFLTAMRTPTSYVPTAGPDGAKIARGKAIFESAETQCSTCHKPDGSWVDGEKHDVGTRAAADPNNQFDTPTLRFVGGTAPYFHDGRYRTLRDLLVGHDGKMGQTKQLSSQDLDSLEAYMRTL
jgi:DNA-binding beta-propeller fold protein YncE/mono/diheme cytochrome c family protein